MLGESGNTRAAPDVADDGRIRVVRAALTRDYLFDRYIERGWSSYRIAEDSGYSSSRVRIRLRELGIPLRPRGGRPLPAPTGALRSEALEAARLYQQGLSLAAVGARFGRSSDWARARVQAAGVQIRTGGAPRGPHGFNPIVVGNLLDEGLGVVEIADRLGFPAYTIRRVIRIQGWPSPGRATAARRPTEDEVRRLYVEQGRSITQTASALGTSVHQVKAALDGGGIPRRTGGLQGMFDSDIATLRELYLSQRLTVVAIAARYGCAQETVAKALARHGIVQDRHWDMDAAT
jgi:transposase-like protein